jgi:uncharacterized membrane protein YidH (DUF202 family)
LEQFIVETMPRETNTPDPSYRLILVLMAALALIALTAYATWRYMMTEPTTRTTEMTPSISATKLR